MYLTTKEAAKKASVSVRTIQNYIKSGKLSSARDEEGNYTIDTAELCRVFEVKPVAKDDANQGKFAPQSDENKIELKDLEIKHLNQQIRLLNDQIDLLSRQLEQAQSREMKLLNMSDTTTKLLTFQNEQKEQEKKKRRWFGRG